MAKHGEPVENAVLRRTAKFCMQAPPMFSFFPLQMLANALTGCHLERVPFYLCMCLHCAPAVILMVISALLSFAGSLLYSEMRGCERCDRLFVSSSRESRSPPRSSRRSEETVRLCEVSKSERFYGSYCAISCFSGRTMGDITANIY